MKTAQIYTDEFNRIIEATKKFVGSPCKNHAEQEYIRLEFSEKPCEVTASALDGYRLSVEHAYLLNCSGDFTVFIKPGIKLPRDQYATITLAENEVLIRCGEFVFGYTQPEPGSFSWRNAIPSTAPTLKIAVNPHFLMDALRAAKASLGRSGNPVILEFHGPLGPVIMRTNKEDFKLVLPVRIGDTRDVD